MMRLVSPTAYDVTFTPATTGVGLLSLIVITGGVTYEYPIAVNPEDAMTDPGGGLIDWT